MDYFPEGVKENYNNVEYMDVGSRFRVNVQGKNVKIFEEKEKEEPRSWWSGFFETKKKRLSRREMTQENTNYDILVKEFKNINRVFVSVDDGADGEPVRLNRHPELAIGRIAGHDRVGRDQGLTDTGVLKGGGG